MQRICDHEVNLVMQQIGTNGGGDPTSMFKGKKVPKVPCTKFDPCIKVK